MVHGARQLRIPRRGNKSLICCIVQSQGASMFPLKGARITCSKTSPLIIIYRMISSLVSILQIAQRTCTMTRHPSSQPPLYARNIPVDEQGTKSVVRRALHMDFTRILWVSTVYLKRNMTRTWQDHFRYL